MSGKAGQGSTAAPHAALYRTYRPHAFDEVRGQEHIVKVLESAIEKGAIGHAYLFAGSRGIGKTSIARIFAAAIGCQDADLHEIDAASNRGIDDIRELREGVHALPFASPYKVYIIDEVHMLTKEAFNALLKTLEEPPAHAVFILATTELHKVPDTIRSRCEVYLFRQPSRQLLAETAIAVAKEEGRTLEPEAAELVALLAEGSFRDALGILQKSLTYAEGKTVSRADVETVSGAPASELVLAILTGLAARDLDAALGSVREASEGNMDARVLAKLLMHSLRAVLLARYVPRSAASLDDEFGAETGTALRALAKEPGITSDTLRAILEAYEGMAYAALPFIPLELALIDLAAPEAAAA
ncbi:MAG TPA: DNA polymerase III subunit gamma/tau [Candidatus Paceibacterota bacterium]|nr:DNA polymerase III subunit gamma/tau [Candidatus Paceibacterota bacterium]